MKLPIIKNYFSAQLNTKKSGNWRFACGPIVARDGMLARCGKKESACKTLIECFWKHFKMKLSKIDHTNSLDPDQAQQNVWNDPKEKGP